MLIGRHAYLINDIETYQDVEYSKVAFKQRFYVTIKFISVFVAKDRAN